MISGAGVEGSSWRTDGGDRSRGTGGSGGPRDIDGTSVTHRAVGGAAAGVATGGVGRHRDAVAGESAADAGRNASDSEAVFAIDGSGGPVPG